MDDLFAPPGNEWQRVSPALARLRRTVLLALAGLVTVVLVVAALLVDAPAWLAATAVVVVVAGVLVCWRWIGVSSRRWGYAERDEDLYITHGALMRRLVAVPYGRMQYVDVQAGPLERAYGIASVHLHTASPGTSARIPGLPAAEAARLRDRLTSLGEGQAAGL